MNIPKLTLPRWPRAERAREPAGAIPLSLVRSAKAASWIAYFCLVYFLWLYTLDIARDRAEPLHVTHMGTWVGEVRIWFPVIVGFAVIAIGIPYVAKIAIPTFMSLNWRENAWPKGWALFIAVSVSVVVFAGTFTVQGDAILEKGRESAVAVAQVEQEKAVLQAQIAAKEAELKSMMENRNAYLAQAASVGAAEWQRSYIERTEPSDPQRDRIVRALGAARAADAVRSDITSLRVRAASATTAAAVTERVTQTSAANNWIAATIDWIQGARAILLSFVMDIVALLMPWIALRLEQARARQLASAPRDDESHMLETREAVQARYAAAGEEAPEVQMYEKAKGDKPRGFDKDTGAELDYIEVQSFMRRKPKSKKSGRKIVDPKTGKKVDDTTEYELAPHPDKVHLNEVYEDAGADSWGAAVGAAVANSDGANSQAETLTPEPEEKADAVGEPVSEPASSGLHMDDSEGDPERDELPPLDAQQELEGSAAQPEAPQAPLILADEEVAPPVPIDDDRLDELVAKGVASEDENGFVTFHSQEDQPSIEQPDQTYNYPRLPAPKEDVAA